MLSYKAIPGWMDYENVYRAAVKASPDPATFVEVGAFYGRSACFMAEEIKASGKKVRFDVIDSWKIKPGKLPKDQPYSQAMTRIVESGGGMFDIFKHHVVACGFYEIINPVRGPSPEAAALYQDESLDFVWIDANHTTACVMADLGAWWPKIKPGGICAGHDFHCYPSVKVAVNNFFSEPLESLRFYVKPQSWLVVKSDGFGDEFRKSI